MTNGMVKKTILTINYLYIILLKSLFCGLIKLSIYDLKEEFLYVSRRKNICGD